MWKNNSDSYFDIHRYASRVKLITNDASKNADNKEIARLKGVSSFLTVSHSFNTALSLNLDYGLKN